MSDIELWQDAGDGKLGHMVAVGCFRDIRDDPSKKLDDLNVRRVEVGQERRGERAVATVAIRSADECSRIPCMTRRDQTRGDTEVGDSAFAVALDIVGVATPIVGKGEVGLEFDGLGEVGD